MSDALLRALSCARHAAEERRRQRVAFLVNGPGHVSTKRLDRSLADAEAALARAVEVLTQPEREQFDRLRRR